MMNSGTATSTERARDLAGSLAALYTVGLLLAAAVWALLLR